MVLLTNVSFWEIVAFAIAASVIFAGTMTIFFIMKWWFQMIFASNWENEEEDKNKAWSTIRYAVLWLFIVWFAVVAVHFAWNFMWADFLRYLDSDQIMKMFDLIIKRLGWDYSWWNSSINNSWVLDF